MKSKFRLQKKRPIFFVIPSLMGGGAERVLISLANHFAKQKIETVLIALNDGISVYAINERVKVIYLAKRKKNLGAHRAYYMILIFYKLLSLLLKYRPVCAVSFITSANLWTGITCCLTRIPFIVSERTSPNRTINQFNYINNQLAAYIYKRSAAVVVSAQAVENCIRENKAFKNLNNIKQITNAVPAFEPVSNTKVHDRKFILGVGRLAYVKGFDQLIKAFNEAKLDDIDLLITGDGEERANLICLVDNLGLSHRVIFAGAKTNLQDYYSQATMFVLPSRNEGYPNALVEAMSFGCPCVAMDCEFGPSEIINNEQNGLLVCRADISALSNAIIRLANDPALSNTLGNNAKNINQTNSSKKILNQWDSLILKHNHPRAFN